jgi:hypothetical protein
MGETCAVTLPPRLENRPETCEILPSASKRRAEGNVSQSKGFIMKRILLATALVAFSAGAAMADNLAGYYGNTVVQTTPDGKVTKSKVKADKTYSSVLPDGTATSGTWSWKDATEACFTQTAPAPAAGQAPICYKVDPRKAGDKWEVTSPDGKVTVKFELVAG